MFNQNANATLNNTLFNSPTMAPVKANTSTHPALARIYEAMRTLRLLKDDSPSDLARAINEAPQTITNWSKRPTGPSDSGILEIQRRFGINATWVRHAEGPMLIECKTATGFALQESDSPASYVTRKDGPELHTAAIPDYYAQRFGELSESGRAWALAKLDEALKEAKSIYGAPPEKRRSNAGS